MERRNFLKLGISGILACASPLSMTGAFAENGPTRLILLGTKGGPTVSFAGRASTASALIINGNVYLIDCGYGTSKQLLKAGLKFDAIRYLFITHQHSDHNLDFGPVLYNAWTMGLKSKINVYGPSSMDHFTRQYFEHMKYDIDIRIADVRRQDLRDMVVAYDVAAGPVMENNDVRVTAARVRHMPVIDAFAFRFDAKDRSIVFSGDTAYSPELIELAKDADVLVHEVVYPPAIDRMLQRRIGADKEKQRKHLLSGHSTPEDVGMVASKANVKTVVLNHLVPGDDESISDEMWADGVRKHFNGKVVIGKDLMEI